MVADPRLQRRLALQEALPVPRKCAPLRGDLRFDPADACTQFSQSTFPLLADTAELFKRLPDAGDLVLELFNFPGGLPVLGESCDARQVHREIRLEPPNH